ncbi:MAG: NRDE family protein [Defluviicoccus sp.]
MCSVVILRRPGHPWPVLIAANRDEMADRPWLAPGRHWPTQTDVIGGLDVLAGGSWLAINDAGVICGVLNRMNTLGPAPNLLSRGDLPLAALKHADADAAAHALAALAPGRFRPFNAFVIDRKCGYWLRALPGTSGRGGAATLIELAPLPEGLSMLTAFDRNDETSPRIGRFLPQFTAAPVPDPDRDDWQAWRALLADRSADPAAGPGGAMTVITPTGFGTVSSSLMALGGEASAACDSIWLFAAGRPGETAFRRVL